MRRDHGCDTCGKLVHYIVKVDFGYGGIDDCECPEWDRMTDEEVEMSNEGRCPYWEEMPEPDDFDRWED